MRRLFYIVLLLSCSLPAVAQRLAKYNVYLRSDAGTDTMFDGRIVRVFGIASRLSEMPHIPAKILYCNEGDTLDLHALSISQGDHHTIHLHGLDATTPNDGDPATSFWLSHMQDTDYIVVASHAGTYLYHCHVADVVHVQMGMYGMIVVRPKDGSQTAWTNGPSFDKSYNWLLSEVDHYWHDSIPAHDAAKDTVHIPPYKPQYFLINGKSETQLLTDDSIRISALVGNKIYLRVASIGFFYQRVIFPAGLKAKKIDSDGRSLDEAIQNDTLELAPGERYGVMLEADNALTDTIRVEFANMNTDSVWSTQRIPITVSASSIVETSTQTADLSFTPNPASEQITLYLPENTGALIELINTVGAIVYSSTKYIPYQINVHSIPNGNYILRVKTATATYLRSLVIAH